MTTHFEAQRGALVLAEIDSQPEMWRRAVGVAELSAGLLPADGMRIAVVGCGTSWFIAQAYAVFREAGGHGITDAFAASEFPADRRYDLIVAITRSGTTTEVLQLLALTAELPPGWQDKAQFTFLGTGPAVGIANEAALKMREAALAWAESYPAYDYRHGPISLAEPHTLVWTIGAAPAGLADQITATGASLQISTGDPLATLVHIQRLAIALALHRGLDPDRPRNLTRSIVLS